jgi:hypothetical protein
MMLAAFVYAALTVAPARERVLQPDSACLHAAGQETPGQRDRSVAALAATRAINTAESVYSAKNKTYASREELAGYLDTVRYNLTEGNDIVPGFSLTFDRTEKGYWFEVADKTDACGFRYISNQKGLIFVAQPIR